MIRAGYDAKKLPRDDNIRALKHATYDKNRLIAAIIFEVLYPRAVARNCLIGAIIFELRRESFETETASSG